MRHNSKFLAALWIILAFACENDNKRHAPVYDAQYEQRLRTFVVSTTTSHLEYSRRQMDSILLVAEPDSSVFRKTANIFETSFGGVSSRYRNDELYSQLLARRPQSTWYSPEEKQSAANKLKLIQQNKVGDVANDFMYVTPAGYRRWLHDIKSEFMLLFFYNPECPACKEMKQTLSQSGVISKNVKQNDLKVLAVYTDKDESIWLNHLREIPEGWINGRDDNEYLYTNGIYDLRAIPTLYLLDSNKRVLLKDCLDVALIEEKLHR